ncbi:MAG: sulfatase-like hydrolase/transferase [Pirellulaceae bacterium]
MSVPPRAGAIITGMMQTSIGAHHHRSCRSSFRGQQMGTYDKNVLPEFATPLPIRFRQAGYWTFNEGGKDDYNFEFDLEELYDRVPKKKGWGPGAFLNGDCLTGKPDGKPFFGQLQLGGGKLGRRAAKVIDPASVPVPPYYPDIPEVRDEIAHHYDCLLETDRQVGQIIDRLKQDGNYENTLIFMFSDHGMLLHRHKQFLYEGGIHMPLIVAGPGIAARRCVTIWSAESTCRLLRWRLSNSAACGNGRTRFSGCGLSEADICRCRSRSMRLHDRKDSRGVTPRFKWRNYLTDRPFMQPSYKDPWPVSKRFRELMAAGQMNEAQLVFFGPEKQRRALRFTERSA